MAKTNYELEAQDLRRQLEEANRRIAELESGHAPKHHEDPLVKRLKEEKQKSLDSGKSHA